jgi:plasmid stabilization system protein ParE
MRIEWSTFAKTQLREIFDFYNSTADERVAQKIVTKIIAATRILSHNPLGAQRELLLDDRPQDFRRLVVGNHKIIYHIADNIIKITDIWDARRNPETLRNRIIQAEA